MEKPKMWKNGGKEDQLIQGLISEGSFSKNTTALSMKKKFPKIFAGFSGNVIRNHLNELKRKHGLYLCETGASGFSDVEEKEDDGPSDDVRSKDAQRIDEPAHSSSQQSITQPIHHNFPVICETYKDPESLLDIVLVMVNVPGGAQNVKIDLNNDGTSVVVNYSWAKSWYNVNDLFKNHVAANAFAMHHPKVLALKSGLEKCRHRIDEAPQSTITIQLPIKVQTATETWKKSGIVRDDGMQIVMAEYVGYVKEYHKKNVDSCVVFNM